MRNIDSWLLGQWSSKDKEGHQFTAVATPASVDHYNISLQPLNGPSQKFDGWISRVDGFSILVLRSLNEGPTFGKFAIYHYELLTPGYPPPGELGPKRIRLSELELDESTRTLDSFHLRAAIRKALKDGTLLVPHNVVADLKSNRAQIPGSIVWTKTGNVTIKGEMF
jgi:hypothetical protein